VIPHHDLAWRDGYRLYAQAYLLVDPSAKGSMHGYSRKGEENSPYLAAQCLLLLGEIQRRRGDTVEAKKTWAEAVEAAARMLDGPEPILDPGCGSGRRTSSRSM